MFTGCCLHLPFCCSGECCRYIPHDFSNTGNGGSDSGTLELSTEGVLRPDSYIDSSDSDFKGTLNGAYYDFSNLPSPGDGWSAPTFAYLYDFDHPSIVIRPTCQIHRPQAIMQNAYLEKQAYTTRQKKIFVAARPAST